MKGIIYCAINKKNNKRYIGQTIQELKERQRKHFTSNSCPYFHSAILKYGKEAFEWKIIDSGIYGSELDNKELGKQCLKNLITSFFILPLL